MKVQTVLKSIASIILTMLTILLGTGNAAGHLDTAWSESHPQAYIKAQTSVVETPVISIRSHEGRGDPVLFLSARKVSVMAAEAPRLCLPLLRNSHLMKKGGQLGHLRADTGGGQLG